MKQMIDIDNWIVEETSAHNDGWTQLHYIEKLRELKDKLNSLNFLNEYMHGEKSDNQNDE